MEIHRLPNGYSGWTEGSGNMLVQAAEDSFNQGLQALHDRRHLEAQALFEAAVTISKRLANGVVQPRYLSYYGVCLATHSGRHHEGVEFCREATSRESYNADLYCNLGRSLLAAGRRREAFEALVRGLRLQAGHRGIHRTLRKMGRRRRPLIPFLSRSNPLNVILGRMTAAMRRR
jgi:hypothetical protein